MQLIVNGHSLRESKQVPPESNAPPTNRKLYIITPPPPYTHTHTHPSLPDTHIHTHTQRHTFNLCHYPRSALFRSLQAHVRQSERGVRERTLSHNHTPSVTLIGKSFALTDTMPATTCTRFSADFHPGSPAPTHTHTHTHTYTHTHIHSHILSLALPQGCSVSLSPSPCRPG